MDRALTLRQESQACMSNPYVNDRWKRGSAMAHSLRMRAAINERARLVLLLTLRGIDWKAVIAKKS